LFPLDTIALSAILYKETEVENLSPMLMDRQNFDTETKKFALKGNLSPSFLENNSMEKYPLSK